MRCPTCEKHFESTQSTALPFCSRRCREIDLGRWLSEEYAVPANRVTKDDPEAAEEYLATEESGGDAADEQP